MVEQRVASRMDRQEILTRRPLPILTVVSEEVVLRSPVRRGEVHKEQLGDCSS
ncbi:helix-turn-helix transcriptional regulator [Streptomyces hirsutus]